MTAQTISLGERRPSVFINYRRDDVIGFGGRLHDALRGHFANRIRVFRDVDDLRAGQDYVDEILKAVASSDAVLVMIGKRWLASATHEGVRRLSLPDDLLKREIALALQRGVLVLPVLLDGATMPTSEALPPELSKLARLQALDLSDARWDHDVERLVGRLTEALLEPAGALRTEKSHILLPPLEVFWSGEPFARMTSRPPRGTPDIVQTRRGYDVFISYAAPDRMWADKVADLLGTAGAKVCVPARQIGQEDRKAFDASCEAKRVVTLWSDAAKNSSDVLRESSRSAAGDQGPVFVVLQGDGPNAFAHLQWVRDLQMTGGYDLGPDRIENRTWQAVLDKLIPAVPPTPN